MKPTVMFSTLALCLTVSSGAYAQTCIGGPDLSHSETRQLAGIGSGFADGTQMVGGGYGIGNRRSFAMGGVNFANFDGVPGAQTSIFANGGFNILEDGSSPVAACPVFGFQYGFGPSVADVSLRSSTNHFGGRVGFRAGGNQHFSVVPTFGASWVAASFGSSFFGEDRITDYMGVAVMGAGLRFNNNRTAVIPTLSMPFGTEADDVSFSVNFATTF